MAWLTPKTWKPGEMATAPLMNQYVRDNMLLLKAYTTDSGAPEMGPYGVGGVASYNTGVGPDALASYSVSIPSLQNPGEMIVLRGLGVSNVAGAGTRTLSIAIGSSGIKTIWTAATAATYLVMFDVMLRRRTVSTGSLVSLSYHGNTTNHYFSALTGLNWDAAQTLTLYGGFSAGTANAVGMLDLSTTYILGAPAVASI